VSSRLWRKSGLPEDAQGPPDGFMEIRAGGVLVWVRQAFASLFDEAGNWNTGPLDAAPGPFSSRRGRGEMVRISLDSPEGGWGLIRHYRRGGLVQHLLGDCYWGRERFLGEVRVSEWARSQGIPTSEIIALRVENKGWGFYGADLLTKEIEDSQDLDVVLKSWQQGAVSLDNGAREQAVRSVASLLQRMHLAGLYHWDLNLKNILLQPAPQGLNSYVIDLDQARIQVPVSKKRRVHNLVRLYRSLEKNGYLGTVLAKRDLLCFIKAYSRDEPEMERDCQRLMRQGLPSLWFHRLFWRLAGWWRALTQGRQDG
jgi:tRNA A-37 threonylcarbamoyl transferase component Bud32